MNWALTAKFTGSLLGLAGSDFLFQPDADQNVVLGAALLADGAVVFIWGREGRKSSRWLPKSGRSLRRPSALVDK